MQPNFKKLAKNYEELGLKALRALIGKPSVYDPRTITSDAPYGAGVKEALDYVAKLGRDYGFNVDTCDGRATGLAVEVSPRYVPCCPPIFASSARPRFP